MGTVVVGYVPKPEGEAALAAGISEAKLRGSKLVVVNSHRGGQEFDGDKARAAEDDMASIKGRLEEAGVEHEVHSGVSVYFRDPDGARIELIADPLGEMYGTQVL